jgi:CheY-like chemotaxis protein
VPALRQKILIVEDDRDLRRMFRQSLQMAGFEVREAGDGSTALRSIDHDPPDLVVLDLMLQMIDGLTIRDELSNNVHTRHIPVVIVTGSALDLDHLDVCVLRKPVLPDQLVDAVRKCLSAGPPGSSIR